MTTTDPVRRHPAKASSLSAEEAFAFSDALREGKREGTPSINL